MIYITASCQNFYADKFTLKNPVSGDKNLFGILGVQPIEEKIGMATFYYHLYRLQITKKMVQDYQIAIQQQIIFSGVEYQIIDSLPDESDMMIFLLRRLQG